MSRTSEFLEVKPSIQAAAAIWLAVRMIESKVAEKLGLVPTKQVCKKPSGPEPTSFWSEEFEKITLIRRTNILDIYSKLLVLLNKYLFSNKLLEDPDLWINKDDYEKLKAEALTSEQTDSRENNK